MDLTVVICTYNGGRRLPGCLGALGAQTGIAGAEWEVLVVDNNCTDNTPRVVVEAGARLSVPVRRVTEARQGLSHARNRGVLEATGRYLAFTDDDTRPEPGWVQAILDTFRRHGCDGVGGKVVLDWPARRPRWLVDDLLSSLAHVDLGTAERLLTREAHALGANMAFSRVALDKIGPFDPRLGRRGRVLLGGEEVDFFERFLDAGLVAVYQPHAIVRHQVDRERLRKRYFRRIYFYGGYSRGRRREAASGRVVLGVPLFLFQQLVRAAAATLRRAGVGDPNAFRAGLNAYWLAGFMVGCAAEHRLRRGAPR